MHRLRADKRPNATPLAFDAPHPRPSCSRAAVGSDPPRVAPGAPLPSGGGRGCRVLATGEGGREVGTVAHHATQRERIPFNSSASTHPSTPVHAAAHRLKVEQS